MPSVRKNKPGSADGLILSIHRSSTRDSAEWSPPIQRLRLEFVQLMRETCGARAEPLRARAPGCEKETHIARVDDAAAV